MVNCYSSGVLHPRECGISFEFAYNNAIIYFRRSYTPTTTNRDNDNRRPRPRNVFLHVVIYMLDILYTYTFYILFLSK